MKRRTKVVVSVVVCIGVVLCAMLAVVVYRAWWHAMYYVEEITQYANPPDRDELDFVDDRLEDKTPEFDETLVDSRPLSGWEVNQSAAVIWLDCPALKPDREQALLLLRPSYADAVKAADGRRFAVLPSANLLDGAAKQFDDGLYAAIELACFQGELGPSSAGPDFVRKVFDRLPEASPAGPFLAAALELAGQTVPLTPAQEAEKKSLLGEFEGNRARSKPISFYNWTPELRQVWRFYRFLQREFAAGELEVPRAIAAVLENDPELLDQYRAVNRLYATLTNPSICLPVDALIAANEGLPELATGHGARRVSVAVFPPSTSRETELFDRVFGMALPANANLMARLIHSIRTGEVNLAPGDNDGWYQHQVYALETLLLPAKGQEGEKLMLTARYKKRLVETFKALMTKRRETHARELGETATCAAPPEDVCPRLRIEPCATFYLRTARAYAFLQDFLLATVGEDRLGRLKGLKKDGHRPLSLAEELDAVRQRFYGFYLVTCEDIGMRPQFLAGEPVDQDSAKAAAIAWLDDLAEDPDMACDTRVAVPVLVDPLRGKIRLWATLGVRLARLDASYARPPKIRPKEEGGPWQDVESYQLGTSSYVIAVDEFAEIEVDSSNVPTRDELRAACDQYNTREAILEALSQKR